MSRSSLPTLLVLAACIVFCAPCAARAASNAQDAMRACPRIRYSTNPHYPPYDWITAQGAFEGASIDLLKLAAPKGVELVPVVTPWKRAMYLAQKGGIDLLVSLRIRPERSEYLEFTTHRAFPNPIVVFARKAGGFAFRSWDDLEGRKGGISLGDTFGNGFDEYWHEHLRIDEAADMDSNFRKLAAGHIDYFVTGLYVGEAYLATHDLGQPIVALSPPISDQDIYFGFSRRSPCAAWVGEFSRNLERLDEQGIPERLLQKHLRRFQEHSVKLPE
ncbi:ABC-type transporter, periplasmic subunit family 3 [Desulfovibrio sp. X2]|uniref:substrate-binding periplasmic protein n=1 Tax=Desulfovibrio sp. X2 TaxID=941449 RepID=UPI000358CBC4|nr:transporter substrate-binding domain-containing protein [Desulfovibrio sp. X2]EPR41082.1 ABC-type transporter, periplasmic subunit family 3 [Desulfovibrio sp. X2]